MDSVARSPEADLDEAPEWIGPAPAPATEPTTLCAAPAQPRKPKRLTQREIARALGLSPATVSMALRDDPLVAADTRARVKAAASDAGYLYNAAAGALRHGRTRLLGLAMGDPSADADLLDAVERRFAAAGWAVQIAFHRGDMAAFEVAMDAFAGRAVEAVIAAPPAGAEVAQVTDALGVLSRAGVAVERLDASRGDAPEAAAVDIAARHLWGLGRRRIALVGGSLDAPGAEARSAAFRATLDALGAPWDRQVWIRGAHAPSDALGLTPALDGLICWDAPTARRAVELAELHGRPTGHSVSIIAIGADAGVDREGGALPITSALTDRGVLAARAAEALLAAVGASERSAESVPEAQAAQLKIGATCGAALAATHAA